MAKYTVIRDTREKDRKGWEWRRSQYCDGTVEQGIPTGDYTLQDYEEIFTIERKGRISEFAHNIFEERFERELERLAEFSHAFILFEFTLRDLLNYPVGSGIPRRRWGSLKFRGPLILKRITEMMRDYPTIHFIFCGDAGKC